MDLRTRERHRLDVATIAGSRPVDGDRGIPAPPVRGTGPVGSPADLADGEFPAPGGRGPAGRTRRRRAWAAVAVLATAAAVAAVAARDGGEDTRVTSAVPGSAATPPSEATATTVASSATTTATAPAVTTTAPAAPTTTVAPSPATAVAPAPAAVPPATAACRNSDDPACGPFRFDPPPAADRPMTLTVTTEPAVVTAGTEVVFRVTLNDPDGVDYNGTIVEYGDEVGLGASQVKACGKHGPWDPPAPDPASALEVVEYRHVYAAPGTYTARFAFDAGPFDCTDAATGVGDRPYASSASGEMTVVVVAP